MFNIKHDKTTKTTQRGFTLVEFMISMALSLAAILVVTSIYITSFQIDSKTIKFSRLNDEVTSIMALLSEDIKRAGYSRNAEFYIIRLNPNAPVSASDFSRYNSTGADFCPGVSCTSPVEFRTLLVSQFAGENNNSCILFAYDFNDNGAYDNTADWREAFGYRLHDKKLETRQGGFSCTQGGWESLTDPNFVTISDLAFACKISDDGDASDYETDTDAGGTVVNIELNCGAGNLPYTGAYNGTVTVDISFTATLVDDSSITLTSSEKVLVRNVSYQ